jgi:hypothetical protein
MTEKLLQFIWQFRYFSQHELCLVSGEAIRILYPGQFNTNQGPDFLDARIKIDGITWAGHIELHLQASDWKKHAHEGDPNYNNVILHVVWENDTVLNEKNIPLLILRHRISGLLLEKYREWMNSPSFVPCEKSIQQVTPIVWLSWKQRLLAERLQRKSAIVQQYLKETNDHWEETLWWLIAANFGIKVNAAAFEAVARSLPIQILAKHKSQVQQLEALLMGQAGLLENDFKEDYPLALKKEYRFLKTKYHLPAVHHPVHFLRMRPVNFPGIRLSQLAALIHGSSHLFSRIRETASVKELKQWLMVTASDYWHHHYVFDEASAFKKKTTGRQMIENIIINTVVPLLFAYGCLHKEDGYRNKALQWLEETAAEKNAVSGKWQHRGIENSNAFDSQALLELKTQYCDKKRCLECAVGNALLKGAVKGD